MGIKGVAITVSLMVLTYVGTTVVDQQATRMRAIENHCAGYDHDTGTFKWEPALAFSVEDMTVAHAASPAPMSKDKVKQIVKH